MVLSAFFIVSIILCLAAMLLLPKSASLIRWLPVMIVLMISANCLTFGVTYLFNSSFSLILPICTNLITTISCIALRLKLAKGTDSAGVSRAASILPRAPFANRLDLVVLLMTLVIAVGCMLFQFGPELWPSYVTPDPARHTLIEIQIIQSLHDDSLFFTHYPIACLMEACAPFLDPIYYYKVMIVAETGFYWLAAMMFYTLIMKLMADGNPFVVGILVVLYMLGYPWHNYIYGFSYWGASVTCIVCLIFVISELGIGFVGRKRVLGLVLTALLLFDVVISYTLFVPPTFLAVFLVIILLGIRAKEKVLRICVAEVATFIVPLIALFCFTYLKMFGATTDFVGESLLLEGSIFSDYFASALVFLPAAIYGAVKSARVANMRWMHLFAVIFICYQLVFLVLHLAGLVGLYYYSKLNFLLWLVVLVYAIIGFDALLRAHFKLLVGYAAVAGVVIIMVLSGANKLLGDASSGKYDPAILDGIVPIYAANIDDANMPDSMKPVNEDDIKLYERALELEDEGAKVMAIGGEFSMDWYNAATHTEDSDYFYRLTDEQILDMVENQDYIFLQTSYSPREKTLSGTEWQDLVDKIVERCYSVYSNSEGHILKVRPEG